MIGELVIATSTGEKGRSFRAQLLAYVLAFGSGSEALRPVWMTVACSHAEAGPFLANLRAGRKAELLGRSSMRFELLRSAGYEFAQQRHREGVAITAYLPGLFQIDPGMVEPSGVRFVVLPGRAWAQAQALDAAPALAHVRRVWRNKPPTKLEPLVATAAIFAAYLDRRTRAPLIPDLAFHLQVLVAALDEGAATLTTAERFYGEKPWGQHRQFGYEEHGVADVGLLPGFAFKAKHDELEAFLAEQVTTYYAATARGRAA